MKIERWQIKAFHERILDKSLFALGAHTNGLPQKISFKLGGALRSRQHIVLLVNSLDLRGDAVEVGVFEGLFSEHILKYCRVRKLYSIDPWLEFSNSEYTDRANAAQKVQDNRYEAVCRRLGQFAQRSEVLRKTSVEGAKQFADKSLDFIYIDANHSYQGCLEDLSVWWPKLKSGGVIAGDDFVDSSISGTQYGVKSAVSEFFGEKNIPFYTTYKPINAHWPNWYCVKNH
jgi:predicted O-methyltransferase YrrM